MTPDIIELVQILTAITACVGALTGIGVGAYVIVRRSNRASNQPRISADVNRRLERIEQAMDAIALEVERISEGQRFTTKLLTERSAVEPSRAPERVITPH